MTVNKILVVGSTGYLGLHILKQLQANNQDFIALARNKKKLISNGIPADRIITAQVSDVEQLEGICQGIDVVISCLGITRQKDGMGYMDIDYQANLNALREAEKSGVRRFIYISAFKAQQYPQVRMLKAKERFVRELLNSTIESPCVIRPNGFFVDMEEIYQMAAKGKVYLFGDGNTRINPIHGEDLANFCIGHFATKERELDIGGPEALSVKQIAELAFQAQDKSASIARIPDVVRRILLYVLKWLPEKWAGAPEFFLTMLDEDAVAPQYGERTLGAYYSKM